MHKFQILIISLIFVFQSYYAHGVAVLTLEDLEKEYPFLVSIRKDLEEVSPTISKKSFDEIDKLSADEKRGLELVRIQIVNNKLYSDGPDDGRIAHTKKIYKNILTRIFKNYHVPNLDLVILAGDGAPVPEGSHKFLYSIPAHVFGKYKNTKSFILVPDLYMMDIQKWIDLYGAMIKKNQEQQWGSKKDIIYWRGANTGGVYNTKNWNNLMRLRLVILSKMFPGIINAEFSNITENQFSSDQSGEDMRNILKELLGDSYNSGDVKEVDHILYKYLISIDGNFSAWKRVPWIMLSNSVFIKQSSDMVQWFYPGLVANENYIEVKRDLSDIFEKLDWLKNNDKEAEKISISATEFIMKNLKPEDIEKHLLYALLLQHKHTDYTLKAPTLPLY